MWTRPLWGGRMDRMHRSLTVLRGGPVKKSGNRVAARPSGP